MLIIPQEAVLSALQKLCSLILRITLRSGNYYHLHCIDEESEIPRVIWLTKGHAASK